MRLLAFALLLLNLALWFGLAEQSLRPDSGGVSAGGLPRVGSLKSAEILPEGRACVTFGWFDSEKAAEELGGTFLVGRSVGYRIKSEERELSPFHWVIIPSQPPQLAREQFRALQKQGVDSYLVSGGDRENAISLGLFESRVAASALLKEKKQQNLNAVLAKFPRNQISYALSFEVRSELVEKLVQAAEAGNGQKFDFIEINTCKGVATPEKTP